MVTVDEMGQEHDRFFIPEQIAQEQAGQIASSRGRLLIASCRAGSCLSSKVVARYNARLRENGSDAQALYLESIDRQFSDSETCVRLDIPVGGYDVFLFQALSNLVLGSSVNEAYMAFLIAKDVSRTRGQACHRYVALPGLWQAGQAYEVQTRTDDAQVDSGFGFGGWNRPSRHVGGS
jgi:hypothetical protein